jgi:hypothetical protein
MIHTGFVQTATITNLTLETLRVKIVLQNTGLPCVSSTFGERNKMRNGLKMESPKCVPKCLQEGPLKLHLSCFHF